MNWEALELDDAHERKAVCVGNVVIGALIVIGGLSITAAKIGQAYYTRAPDSHAAGLQPQRGLLPWRLRIAVFAHAREGTDCPLHVHAHAFTGEHTHAATGWLWRS